MNIIFHSNQSFSVTDLTIEESKWILDFFTFKHGIRKYDYKKKDWYYETVEKTIPKVISATSLLFPMGYIFVFTNLFYKSISPSLLNDITAKFKNTEFTIDNYYDLVDENDTYFKLSELIKNKRGVLQIPTGKGKTEMIATLAMNIMAKGEKVLVTSEQGKVLEEIRDRIAKLGHIFPKKRNPNDLIYIIKPSAFCKSYEFSDDWKENFGSNVKYIISDEAETVPNATFMNKLFPILSKVEYLWGFTATSNKLSSLGIPKDASLKPLLNVYSDLVISYFGFSVSNELPTGYNIKITTIDCDIRVHPDISDYHKVIQTVTNSDLFGMIIREILNREDNLFVPINSRVAFSSILKKSWVYNGKTLLICGDGCQVYDNNVYVDTVSLSEAKRMIKDKEVRLILGTMSSYRGIDFHGLKSVLMSFDKQPDLVKQIIGRLTRGSDFSIYLIKPKEYVPYLRNAFWCIIKEIKQYYSKCNLKYNGINLIR